MGLPHVCHMYSLQMTYKHAQMHTPPEEKKCCVFRSDPTFDLKVPWECAREEIGSWDAGPTKFGRRNDLEMGFQRDLRVKQNILKWCWKWYFHGILSGRVKSTKRTTAMFGDVVHRTVWFVMCLTNTAYGFAVESSTANWWHPPL